MRESGHQGSARRRRFDMGLDPRDVVRYRGRAERSRMRTALGRLRKLAEGGVEPDDLYAPERRFRPPHHHIAH